MDNAGRFRSRFHGTRTACANPAPDSRYRVQAVALGVQYLGTFDNMGVALFQDPVTGSSFAVRDGESVESGIHRVRRKFGIFFP